MAYSELIKSFHRIRPYMRSFYVYGFRHRMEHDKKSARSYDNERRRIESWLGDYLKFEQDADGKRVFLSVDSRAIAENPLYQAYKAKSFTDRDIMLHFYLLDLLDVEEGLSLAEIMDLLLEYLGDFPEIQIPDESSVRKKLKEYENIGLVRQEKQGKQVMYYLVEDDVNVDSWADAIAFFSEAAPLGVIGSYIKAANLGSKTKASDLNSNAMTADLNNGKEIDNLNRKETVEDINDKEDTQDADRKENDIVASPEEYFRFKHHYILNAIDSEILYSLFIAMGEEKTVILRKGQMSVEMIPLRIYVSTQTGRQYVLGKTLQGFGFGRLDTLDSAKVGNPIKITEQMLKELADFQSKIWGTARNKADKIEHLEFVVHAEPDEYFILERLEREKRNGTITDLGDGNWQFSTDVFDALEMLPWIRTFIGRIVSLKTDNEKVKQRYYEEMKILYQMYGGEEDAVL